MAFQKHYLINGRLADVIALISVLGHNEKGSFQSENTVQETLGGPPRTAKNWFEIVTQHPEFFRFNLEKTEIILLLRNSGRKQDGHKGEPEYPSLGYRPSSETN